MGERTTEIHPTAVVHPGACFGPGVRIGPFAVIGLPPQDLKWKPDTPSGVRIGEGTVIREYATIHRASTPDGFTVLGKECYLMAQGHIAHDCQIGDNVIMTGYTALTGFVQVGDRAVISGLTGIHQFVRIGTLAMVSGCSRIAQDVPPYFLVEGNPAEVRAVNIVGLRRAGVTADVRLNIQRAYKILYRSGRAPRPALEQIRSEIEPSPEIERLCEFIASSKRGIC